MVMKRLQKKLHNMFKEIPPENAINHKNLSILEPNIQSKGQRKYCHRKNRRVWTCAVCKKVFLRSNNLANYYKGVHKPLFMTGISIESPYDLDCQTFDSNDGLLDYSKKGKK